MFDDDEAMLTASSMYNFTRVAGRKSSMGARTCDAAALAGKFPLAVAAKSPLTAATVFETIKLRVCRLLGSDSVSLPLSSNDCREMRHFDDQRRCGAMICDKLSRSGKASPPGLAQQTRRSSGARVCSLSIVLRRFRGNLVFFLKSLCFAMERDLAYGTASHHCHSLPLLGQFPNNI